jgi:ABC-type Mn2+/Zn2+ transport system permease subunit
MDVQKNIVLPYMLSLPVKVADHYKFSVIFFLLGFILTCWFSLYIVTYKRNDRKITREFLLALFASIYLGLGSFFLMLSLGVNV